MNIMMPVDGNNTRENFRHVSNKGGGGISRFRVQVSFPCYECVRGNRERQNTATSCNLAMTQV